MLHINLSLPLTVSFFFFHSVLWNDKTSFVFILSFPTQVFLSLLLHLLCFWFSLNFATFSYLFHFSWKVCNTKNMVSYRPSFHFRRFSLRNKSWRIEKFRKNRVCEKIKCVRYLHQVIAKSKDRKLFFVRTSNIEHRTSDIEHWTSNIEHRTSNIEHRTSNIAHQTSNLQKIKNTTSQNILQSC